MNKQEPNCGRSLREFLIRQQHQKKLDVGMCKVRQPGGNCANSIYDEL